MNGGNREEGNLFERLQLSDCVEKVGLAVVLRV